MIRPAKAGDTAAIVDLALESVARDPLPVKPDPAAMHDMARQLIGNPAHFVWVQERDGRVVACVAACVQPAFWFRGLQASVILYYARPGGSVALLLRKLAAWLKSRSGIKLGIVELEPRADARLVELLRRFGFARQSTNMTYVR